eukprot:TRINITY_DN41360_c0_g1_i5.p2 TRINITY_DN41360_c0_g1~~TRINITY_DN41360_c0_g1_i5.p2  ORF type:complete len:263 (-),score=-1.15 TRINITY_DN41360_c0_g1_i5:108-896(-)
MQEIVRYDILSLLLLKIVDYGVNNICQTYGIYKNILRVFVWSGELVCARICNCRYKPQKQILALKLSLVIKLACKQQKFSTCSIFFNQQYIIVQNYTCQFVFGDSEYSVVGKIAITFQSEDIWSWFHRLDFTILKVFLYLLYILQTRRKLPRSYQDCLKNELVGVCFCLFCNSVIGCTLCSLFVSFLNVEVLSGGTRIFFSWGQLVATIITHYSWYIFIVWVKFWCKGFFSQLFFVWVSISMKMQEFQIVFDKGIGDARLVE